jgi:hypothetical protein
MILHRQIRNPRKQSPKINGSPSSDTLWYMLPGHTGEPQVRLQKKKSFRIQTTGRLSSGAYSVRGTTNHTQDFPQSRKSVTAWDWLDKVLSRQRDKWPAWGATVHPRHTWYFLNPQHHQRPPATRSTHTKPNAGLSKGPTSTTTRSYWPKCPRAGYEAFLTLNEWYFRQNDKEGSCEGSFRVLTTGKRRMTYDRFLAFWQNPPSGMRSVSRI